MAIKITDLVDPNEIEKLKQLDAELSKVLDTYTKVAKDLAKGLEISVSVVGDIDRLEKILVDKGKEASKVQQQLTQVIEEHGKVVANTTNTISRQLMEQERVNKTQRDSYKEHERVKRLLDQFHDTYEGQIQRLMQVEAALKRNNEAQKANEKALKAGTMSATEYQQKQSALIALARQMRQEKSVLNQLLTAEEKANLSVESSYANMSQQLELLKKAYKQLSEEGRDSEYGKELEETIQNLDAHLKDLAADQGEHQRNVGNYAIACQNGVASTEDLNRVLQLNAATIDGCIEQNKSLEKAKNQLDQSDENYAETLDKINAKIKENMARIMDVSDVMEKMPSTVEEAEKQNKRLAAALKMVDVNAEGASETIQQYRERIEANNEMIERVTGSNEEYADSLLSIIGMNSNFGQSFQSLANSGGHSFIDGLNTKVKAFGKTLIGLIANPWVLTLLGIAGVAAGVKWWYDYNKGLVEATKLTKDFTDLSGSELKAVRNEVQAVADSYDKDFKEVVEAANAMSKQFGISVQESLKLIEDGFAAGADVNGEFLENIKEYPAYFREAGLSASEFIAITTQANQAGIYSDKGIDVIKEGNLRIREMTKATAEALEGIGISSKQVQQDLADGSKTTFDIMQQVSEKLAEFPESSSEVGTALADIFGGPGEDAGLQYILTLKDIDTNLDNVKDRAGELGKLQEEQLRSQVELENVIASVFDATGGSFESMTTKAKIFVNDGIISIIKGCVDIVNWFIELYNNASQVRLAVSAISFAWKALWDIVKTVFGLILNGFKAVGEAAEGFSLILSGKLSEGINKMKTAVTEGVKGVVSQFKTAGKEIADDFATEFNKTIDGKLSPVTLKKHVETDEDTNPSGNNTPESPEEKAARLKAKEEVEKRAKEELKLLHQLEESKIAIMKDGHEKDLSLIRLKYKKKLDAVTGDSEKERQLRISLTEQMQNELAACEMEYQQELSKINFENRLAAVEKGSKEELDLKLAQLEASRAAELKATEKTGADINLINAKFNKERENLENEYADRCVQKIQERYADEQSERDNAMMSELNILKKKYAEELKLAGNNESKRAELKEQYEAASADITERYAIQSADATVKMFEEMLKTDNLTVDERERMERELAAAKISLAKSVTDATIAEIEKATDADNKATEKRKANAQQWLQIAADSLNTISELVATVYDAKITKIEEEQEANTAAGEAEQERITELVEKKVITEEEGEARKRAAEAQTAKKNEELEKKKQQLKHKQAVWDKANGVAQAGIATALAIMNALQMEPFPVGIAMAAIAGAMGAVQVATILATPIPKYAKGTDRHKGGPAIVGDGGVPELVILGGQSWITPDTPTVVDLPAGAIVKPNIDGIDNNTPGLVPLPMAGESNATPVIINNDYRRLEEKMDAFIFIMRRHSNRQYKSSIDNTLNRYIADRI